MSLKFTKVDFGFESVKPVMSVRRPSIRVSVKYRKARTHNSSISAGVRRVTSGKMNQAMSTATDPVPAKL